ncbi:UNVERIFIED_CONTAM: hypothetical protein GTU68_025029 [Idotea baltica]|nr:hypothetical protein [Idotea baltica]
MYQDAGVWSKALEVADKEDRIHLRSTHYNYAKHLESKGDLSGAISHYEKSDTYRFEVPRMLFDELPTLEDYIMHTDDRGLRRWWAQYLESTAEMETALQFYEAAGDHLSLVRVYCYCNNLEKAAEIANETGDRAACYHLARQYENVDQVKEAIHFFSRAQAYGNAIRICKENTFDEQLLNLALVAGPQEQIDAARYFMTSERPQLNKAVMLYHKAGLISKYLQALDLCVEHNVLVTEDLAEKFTLPSDTASRNQILEKVAECAYAQENYKLATKKFTQAGNKSAFYDSCAQIEIDEYQNYEKAGVALAEAFKVLEGYDDPKAREKKMEIVIKMEKVNQFVQMKKLLGTAESDHAVRGLYELLEAPDIDSAVRKGDIFAAMVESYAKRGDFKQALGLLQEMRGKCQRYSSCYSLSFVFYLFVLFIFYTFFLFYFFVFIPLFCHSFSFFFSFLFLLFFPLFRFFNPFSSFSMYLFFFFLFFHFLFFPFSLLSFFI